MKICKHMILA